MLGVDERDLDVVDVGGPAEVDAGDGVPIHTFGRQPASDLEVGDDLRSRRLGDLQRIVHVVEVAVSDEHQVTALDAP